jgi:hypothetical protein
MEQRLALAVIVLIVGITTAQAQSYCTPKSDGTPRITKTPGRSCPDGYFATGDCCEGLRQNAKPAMPKIPGKSCPSGYYVSGGSCVSYR